MAPPRSLIFSAPPTTGGAPQEPKSQVNESRQDSKGPALNIGQAIQELKSFLYRTYTPNLQDSYDVIDMKEVDNSEVGSTSTGQVEWSSREPSRDHISFQLSWWGYRM